MMDLSENSDQGEKILASISIVEGSVKRVPPIEILGHLADFRRCF